MVGSCSAFGCNKTRYIEQDEKILFHKFPLNDPERLKKWLKAIKRESWQPTKHSLLCSQHFTVDSYKSNPRHHLKDDAVPTISCFSANHPKIERKNTDLLLPKTVPVPVVVLERNAVADHFSRLNGDSKSLCHQSDTLHKSRQISSNKKSTFKAKESELQRDPVLVENGETTDDDISDIEFLDSEDTEQRLDIMTAHYKKARKKLKMCQQRCALYKKEITALKVVIDNLRQINSVSDDN